MTIIERERSELLCQLTADGPDCPESMFIQQSLDLLQERQNGVLKLLPKNEESKHVTHSSLEDAIQDEFENLTINTASTTNATCNDEFSPDFLIGEDSNLTLQDIDITPVVADSKHFYFYQASDGQHLYMHSVNIRMLQAMYGSLDKCPNIIRGKILQKESCSMTELLRKRLKYLQHLPVTSQFEVVEIRLDDSVLSEEVLATFKGKTAPNVNLIIS